MSQVSTEFWYRSANAYEQPQVTFKNKVYAEVLLRDIASGDVIKQTYQTSNVLSVNAQAQQLISPPTVKSFGNDKNNDGLVDNWNVTVQLRLP